MTERERARAANEENTAGAVENPCLTLRLARQQVLCLASGQEDQTRGYEKANCRRGCAQGLRHCPGDGSVLCTQDTDTRFEAGWDVGPSHLSVDFRRWDPSWIPGFPFGRLSSDRPEVPIVLFEMPELGTMLRSPAPSLRLEALVERSCPACYKCLSTAPFLGSLSFLPIIFSHP